MYGVWLHESLKNATNKGVNLIPVNIIIMQVQDIMAPKPIMGEHVAMRWLSWARSELLLLQRLESDRRLHCAALNSTKGRVRGKKRKKYGLLP